MGLLGRGDPLALLERLDSPVVPVVWGLLDRWERKGSRERRARLDQPDTMETRAWWDCRGQAGLQDPPERMETRVRPEGQGRRAAKETKANLDPQDHMGVRDLLASPEYLVWTGSLGHGGSRGCTVRRGMKDCVALKEQLAP